MVGRFIVGVVVHVRHDLGKVDDVLAIIGGAQRPNAEVGQSACR